MEAASHIYLGANMQSHSSSVTNEFIEGKVYDIILIGTVDLVLFPTEVMPIRILQDKYQNIQQVRLHEQYNEISQSHFGIVNVNKFNSKIANVGTIVEIKSIDTVTNHSNDVPILAVGKCRFRVLSSQTWRNIKIAKVVILPEVKNISLETNQFLSPGCSTPSWVSIRII